MKATSFSSTTLALVLAGANASAASDKPGDYANAIALTVSARNAVVQLRLPKEVYLHSRSAALNDLRLFDATGKILPHALIAPAPQIKARTRQIPVKVFAVPGGSPDGDTQSAIEIKTSADGAVTSVTTRRGTAGNSRTLPPGALVLDIGTGENGASLPVNALVFTLPADLDQYQAQVQLEVSDDLQHWDTIGYAHLSRLRNKDFDTLQSNRMEFATRSFRYARLAWREGRPVPFAAILAESPETTEIAPALESATFKPREGLIPGELVYDAGIAIPVRRLNLLFSEPNIVMPAWIGTHVKQPIDKHVIFAPRRETTFYQIHQDGLQRNSKELVYDDVHAEPWVVRSLQSAVARPDLKLSWAPSSLVFMASGAPPYTLHFGRASAAPGQRDIAQVAPGFSEAELRNLEQAVPGTYRATAVQATDDDAGSGRWRIMTLWGVLLLGVGVLGFMAWRLLKQMKETG